MKKLLSVCVVAVMLTSDLSARDFGYGAGNNSCSYWSNKRAKNGNWHTSVNWILGWLSAYEYYSSSDAKMLRPTEPFEIALFVDQYCEKNPRSKVLDATKALEKYLRR